MASLMQKTLIVGFGSPFGNDQFGWLVIDEIEKRFPNSVSIVLYKSKGNGVDWLSEIKDADKLIIVDAVKSDKPVGYLHEFIFDEDINLEKSSLFTSSHSVSIVDSVELARTLGMFTQPIRFLGVEVG